MSTNKALAAVSAIALGLAPATALAHTNSIGYVGDGSGGITFWYGSWHSGTTFNEGELKLEGANGTTFGPTITQFNLLESSTPAGLIPGTNYFASDGVTLQPYDETNCNLGGCSGSYTWQGVTFTGLSAGDYTFTYIPLGDPQSYQPNGYPTMDWMPFDSVTLTSTVSLSSAVLSGDANLNGIPDVQEFGTVQQPSTPTLVSSAPGTPHVHTSTSTQDRYVFDTTGNTRTYYQDTVTTTHTTPTTVDTYSDGSTVTTNGTMVTTTSVTQATVPVWVETRTYSVAYGAYTPSGAPVVTHTPSFQASEGSGKQKINVDIHTEVTTPTTRSVTTTEVYTKVYTDGSPDTVTTGTSVVTSESSSAYQSSHTYRDFSGRIDQLEVLDGVSGALNGLLDHEPMTNHKKRFRVFENNTFAHSYNADGYNAKSTIFGGGFEYDITKGWTAGAQYNDLHTEMEGVDSISHLKRQHVGIFNSFHGRDVALITNAGASRDKYNVARTVEYMFGNWANVEGQQWWINNRLYLNNSGWIKPFLGHTVHNITRNAYTETGSPQSARSVEAFNQTTHVGEAGLKLETRFGGKKKDVIGVSVEGAYATDNSYSATASVDVKEVLYLEGTHAVADGLTNNSVAAKVKFRF